MFKVMKSVSTLCVMMFFCMASFSSYANPGHGNGNGNGNKGQGHEKAFKTHGNPHSEMKFKPQKSVHKTTVVATLSDQDKINIVNYLQAHPFQGTALPPGIAKNLARGKPLPPGIAKKVLPEGLLALLPKYAGFEYLAAGNNILLVNSTTKIVADIITGLLK